MYFSDVEKIGETDFIEKPKSIYGTPLSEQVAMRLISGGRVTFTKKIKPSKNSINNKTEEHVQRGGMSQWLRLSTRDQESMGLNPSMCSNFISLVKWY